MSYAKHQGYPPSATLKAAVLELLTEHGELAAAKRLGLSRACVVKIAAGFTVRKTTLFYAANKLGIAYGASGGIVSE